MEEEGKSMKMTRINRLITNWLYIRLGILMLLVMVAHSFAQQIVTSDRKERVTQLLKNIITKKHVNESKVELQGHTENPQIFMWGVDAVAFSPDGNFIASGTRGAGDNLILWDAITGEKIAALEGHSGVMSILFSSDGSKMLSGGDIIILWDVATRTELMTFDSSVGRKGGTIGMAWSPDEKILVAVSNAPKQHATQPQSLVMWNVSTGKKITELEGHPNLVSSVSFSPNGKKIVSGSYSRQPMGPRNDKGSLIVWDVNDVNNIERTTLLNGNYAIEEVKFLNDHILISTDSEGSVILWNIKDDNVKDISLSVGSNVHSIGAVLYNSSTNQLFLEANLWFDKKDVNNRAMFNMNYIKWNGSIYREPLYPDFSSMRKGYCKVAVLSPYQDMIASGGETLQLLNAKGELITTLIEDKAGIQSLAFSPDGKKLVSGSGGKNNLVLWRLVDQEEIILRQVQKYNDDQVMLIEKLCIAESQDKIVQLTQAEYVLFEKLDLNIKNLFKVKLPLSWKQWLFKFPKKLYRYLVK